MSEAAHMTEAGHMSEAGQHMSEAEHMSEEHMSPEVEHMSEAGQRMSEAEHMSEEHMSPEVEQHKKWCQSSLEPGQRSYHMSQGCMRKTLEQWRHSQASHDRVTRTSPAQQTERMRKKS
jgi:hypothetical protein